MMTKTLLISGCAVCIACAGACSSPFHTVDADYGVRVGLDRLRTIEPLDLAEAEREPTVVERIGVPVTDPFVGLERRTLTLEECRALALENTLDLQVALINPTTSELRLTEEEAAFEAIFNAAFTRCETDQPTS